MNQIHLLDIEHNIAHQMGELKPYYEFEISRRKPGPASDILRTILLKNFGGLYSDIDVLCTDSLGPIHDKNGIQLNFGNRRTTGPNTHPLQNHINIQMEKAPNNDLIISRPNHPFMNEFMQRIVRNYEENAATILPPKTQDFTYKNVYDTLGSSLFRKQWTIYATGPGALVESADSTKMPITKECSVADKFIFGCSLSWTKKNNQQPLNHNEEVARLVKCISMDLHQEPRVLRMANYMELCSSDTIMDEAVSIIVENNPELFSQVEIVHNKHDDSVNQGYFPKLSFLMDEKIFPMLDKSKTLFNYAHNLIKEADSASFDERMTELTNYIRSCPFEIKVQDVNNLFNQLTWLPATPMEKQGKGMMNLLEAFSEATEQNLVTPPLLKEFSKRSLNLTFLEQMIDKSEITPETKVKLIKHFSAKCKSIEQGKIGYEPNLSKEEKVLHFRASAAQMLRKLDEKTGQVGFESSILERISFQSLSCSNLSFRESRSQEANFRYTKLNQCDFSGANLTKASFDNCQLSAVNFNGADISGVKFSGTKLDNIEWGNVKFDLNNPPNLDWNAHGIKLLHDKLIALGESDGTIQSKQKEAEALVKWIAPKITDKIKLLQLSAFIEKHPEHFHYLENTQNSSNHPSSLKNIVSDLKGGLQSQQSVNQSVPSTVQNIVTFNKIKAALGDQIGRNQSTVTVDDHQSLRYKSSI